MGRSNSACTLVVLIMGMGWAITANADTITVCWDGSGDYPTIQEGINAAQNGDEVVVCDGTYAGAGNRDLDFGGKLITVRSQNGPDACVIDCAASDADRHRAFLFQSAEGASAVVEGFTIRNGYMTHGGAIRCINGSGPTIRNCVFQDNTVRGDDTQYSGRGGAIQSDGTADMLIADCVFLRNVAFGGTVGNLGTGRGGAIACMNGTGDIVIAGCMFRDNSAEATVDASGGSGAIHLQNGGHLWLSDCTFVGNRANANGYEAGGGGALVASGTQPDDPTQGTPVTMTDCVFVRNSSDGVAGACVFGRNASVQAAYCVFAGNQSEYPGGAVKAFNCKSDWHSCLFIGNSTARYGGGLHIINTYAQQPTEARLTNCTVAHNFAGWSGGALGSSWNPHTTCIVANCILWGNTPDQLDADPNCMAMTYSDVQDGAEEEWFGTGCIDAQPLFVDGPWGTWTSEGTYEDSTGRTTFTDSAAGWDPNELVGGFLRPNLGPTLDGGADPNTLPPVQSLITANGETTVTVWGDLAALGTPGALYQINDYRLAAGSPCIDAGDNTAVPPDELDLDRDGDTEERSPLDLDYIRRFTDRPAAADTGVADPPDYPQVVDMGAYEYGTFGDLDGDCAVNLSDLAGLLGSCGATVGPGYDHGDVDLDEDVDLADLAALLGVYGLTCD